MAPFFRRLGFRAVPANTSLQAETPGTAVVIKAHDTDTVNPQANVVDSTRTAGILNLSLSTGD